MTTAEQHLIDLSDKIVEIELRKDADALERYIADDYVGVDPSGALIDKEIAVGRYRRDDFHLYEHGVSDISVTVTAGTALEIGVMTLRGRLGAFEFGGRYRYIHYWLHTADGWKVRASQLTPILRD
ncbi:nuclear transport factor 2 family protein [Methylococcus sp. EFPC2]|uniref:nuclear transport factor 2 family protein n=1 Tax=Methylococcus sp. EFPC2 TaxID=2812648 RepID=UPI001966D6EE|nr:nuclear transport factor 2 family protein [Methylococcus sp. EFPC2]QSA95656.1 nuclear transport factor 2 family protein [Methylococcus sp. EFPC2]